MAMEERTGGSGNASSLLGLFNLYLVVLSLYCRTQGQYDATPYIFRYYDYSSHFNNTTSYLF